MDIEIPTGGLGIPRHLMPQIAAEYIPEFFEFLHDRGIQIAIRWKTVASLKPCQGEFDEAKVLSLLVGDHTTLALPVVSSEDDYLIDGHHRWLALYNLDPWLEIKSYTLQHPIQGLLPIIKEFPKVFYKDVKEGSIMFCPGTGLVGVLASLTDGYRFKILSEDSEQLTVDTLEGWEPYPC